MARIRPSGLALTVACAASVTLQEQVPVLPPTEDELEGAAAHWVALRYAAGFGHELPVGAKFISLGREWAVDMDMVVGAHIYANVMGGFNSNLRLEDGVTIPRVHPSECAGTPDAWRFYPNARAAWEGGQVPQEFVNDPAFVLGRAKLIRVGDYKYGHRYVEAFECYQTGSYCSGVMERLGLNDNDPDLFAELILVQPRSYHRDGPVRAWRGHVSMLRAILNIARSAAQEALGENPRATTNSQCIDCRARHACVTLQRATQSYIEFSTTGELVEMPPEAMGQELAMVEDAIKRLEARATGLAAQAEALIRQGKSIAHYHMAAGQSRLIYRDDVNIEEMVGLGELLNIPLRKPQTLKDCLVTPTQAVALGIDASIMEKYSHRPPAAFRLTRDNLTTARKVFSK